MGKWAITQVVFFCAVIYAVLRKIQLYCMI